MPHRRPPALPVPLQAVLAAAAGLALATAASAAPTGNVPIWKSVGPDGRVVFSDHPPTSAPAAVVNRPPSTTPIVRVAPKVAAPPAPPAPVASGASSGEATAPGPATIDPRLLEAVVAVLAQRDMLPRLDEMCASVDPTARDRWHASALGWKQRNAQYVSQAERVLAIAVPPARRPGVASRVDEGALRQVAPGMEGSTAARRRWCEDTTARIDDGDMDLRTRTEWVDPLMSYQPWR